MGGEGRKEKMVAEVIKSNPFGLDSIPAYLLYLFHRNKQYYYYHAYLLIYGSKLFLYSTYVSNKNLVDAWLEYN